ncbi:MAG: hypothetical protein RBT65_18460 [Methanolobus sp.]|nr:hypothetical protein [Methanolobus sp.]
MSLLTIHRVPRSPTSDHRTIMITDRWRRKSFIIHYYKTKITIDASYLHLASRYEPYCDFFMVGSSILRESSVSRKSDRDKLRIALERVDQMLDVGSGYSHHESNINELLCVKELNKKQIILEKLYEFMASIIPSKLSKTQKEIMHKHGLYYLTNKKEK